MLSHGGMPGLSVPVFASSSRLVSVLAFALLLSGCSGAVLSHAACRT